MIAFNPAGTKFSGSKSTRAWKHHLRAKLEHKKVHFLLRHGEGLQTAESIPSLGNQLKILNLAQPVLVAPTLPTVRWELSQNVLLFFFTRSFT